MPPNPAPHLIGYLMEMGLTEAAGMGMVALSWREITAWQDGTGIVLSSWQARLIRRLSTEYVAELHAAEDESRGPPWKPPVTQREIDSEEDRLRMLLG